MTQPDGAAKLAAFLEKYGVSKTAAGEALGVTHAAIISWLNGQPPNREHRRAIATWTNGEIAEEDWPLTRRELRLQEATKRVQPFVAVDQDTLTGSAA